MSSAPTAAILLIGDELLSGRTQDKNFNYLASQLFLLGIDLKEVRVVGDVTTDIIDAVRPLSTRYTHVFTTGGIGPTHDDITTDSIAQAFGVEVIYHPQTVQKLREYFETIGRTANDDRLRMARLPKGAEIIENPKTIAPGFRLHNVYVLAGIPDIMQTMFEGLAPKLQGGTPMQTTTLTFLCGEGDLAGPLRELQNDLGADVRLGSYPFMENGTYATRIVVQSRVITRFQEAQGRLQALGEALMTAGKCQGIRREDTNS